MSTAILIIATLLAAAVVLCGYTTIRLPVRREEGKRHIACVGDSVTYGCTLPLFFLRRYPAVLQRLIGSGYGRHPAGHQRFQRQQLDLGRGFPAAIHGADRGIPRAFSRPADRDWHAALRLQADQAFLLHHE